MSNQNLEIWGNGVEFVTIQVLVFGEDWTGQGKKGREAELAEEG